MTEESTKLKKRNAYQIISIHSVPRSGSSWLLSIFNSHMNTKCVYQPLFSYAFKDVLNENSTKCDFNTFIDNISVTNDDFCTMKSNLHTNNGKNLPLIFNKNITTSVVMKHVTHHYLIDHLINFDSNIKIIGLIRNPENTIASQMKASHENLIDWLDGTDKNIGKECYFGFNKWIQINKYFIKLKEKFEHNVYLIEYENLLKNPHEEINKLFIFCGLTMDLQTENFIHESTTISDTYDYSVFRDKKTMLKSTHSLPSNIIDHISKHTVQYNLN